ncbi:hypothetical protein E2562_034409, partial [Oryza meyeriana var. granulata]
MAAGPSMMGKEGLEVYGPRARADCVAKEGDSSSSRACLVGLRDGLSSEMAANFDKLEGINEEDDTQGD